VDSTYDQVYRGYTYEEIMPRLSEAVEETEGEIVTYDGETAITPYFSRSDGRTRDWSEVWYGESPDWLISVPVPCEEGEELWGHGVGMSAQGALCMLNEDNDLTYEDILTYFYTGIDITDLW
jgi:stage II sporulation protein D